MDRDWTSMSKEKRHWNVPVSAEMDDRVEKAVLEDSHVSKSELVRDAVRRFLDKAEGA
jgi:Arc/MetJ-type ribon-helix-helix transcriptional regulator